MSNNDAYQFYADDRHQQPGRLVAERASRGRMTGHVPVRFPEESIVQIKAIAEHEGLTVSSWIRRVVMHEVERRLPPKSVAREFGVRWTITGSTRVTTVGVKPDFVSA